MITRHLLIAAMTLGSTSPLSVFAVPIDLSTGSAGFANTPALGLFVDNLTFTITTPVTANSSVTTAVNGNQNINFTSISLTGSSGPVLSFNQLFGDPVETWAVPAAGGSLAAGSYTLTLAGVNSAGGGSYGGNFAITAIAGGVTAPGPTSNNVGILDLSTGSAGFFATPRMGAFVDTFAFIIAASGTANGTITTAVNGAQDVDFTSILLTGPSGPSSFNLLRADPVEIWALPLAGASLAPGPYTLTLTGFNSAAAGSYGGNFAVTAQPAVVTVPEPQTHALFLLGLVVLSAGARRRRRRIGASA